MLSVQQIFLWHPLIWPRVASLPLCPDALLLLVAFLAPHTLSSGSGEAAGEPGMEVEEERLGGVPGGS